MAKKKQESCECTDSCCGEGKWHKHMQCKGGAIYGLGFIGALIFYIQTATSFGMGVLGVLKAIVWPAMLVFKLLGL